MVNKVSRDRFDLDERNRGKCKEKGFKKVTLKLPMAPVTVMQTLTITIRPKINFNYLSTVCGGVFHPFFFLVTVTFRGVFLGAILLLFVRS